MTPPSRPNGETLLMRAVRLRCPRCGEGRLFDGVVSMPSQCVVCGLVFDRAPGYYLGSTYINYGLTAVSLTALYMVLHFGFELTNRQLTWPLVAFCVLIPLVLFRHSRALWLAFDSHFDRSVLEDPDRRVRDSEDA